MEPLEGLFFGVEPLGLFFLPAALQERGFFVVVFWRVGGWGWCSRFVFWVEIGRAEAGQAPKSEGRWRSGGKTARLRSGGEGRQGESPMGGWVAVRNN